MERLNRLTEEITAERLDRRLPVTNAKDELGRLTWTINAMISRLENGLIDNPTLATVTRYAKALGKRIVVSLVDAEEG